MKTKHPTRRADMRIAAAYHRTCSGVQIPIMDITKVYQAGRAAIAAGADDAALDAALVAFVNTIRVN